MIHDIVAGNELSNVASTPIPTTQVINQTLHYIVIVETQYRRLAHMEHTVKVAEPAGKCTFKACYCRPPMTFAMASLTRKNSCLALRFSPAVR